MEDWVRSASSDITIMFYIEKILENLFPGLH